MIDAKETFFGGRTEQLLGLPSGAAGNLVENACATGQRNVSNSKTMNACAN
jgi:hypothetical protein